MCGSDPINVLTGLDYWLDNLMCNVPEVVMWFGRNSYLCILSFAHVVSGLK
jgi:hypothetical protein